MLFIFMCFGFHFIGLKKCRENSKWAWNNNGLMSEKNKSQNQISAVAFFHRSLFNIVFHLLVLFWCHEILNTQNILASYMGYVIFVKIMTWYVDGRKAVTTFALNGLYKQKYFLAIDQVVLLPKSFRV